MPYLTHTSTAVTAARPDPEGDALRSTVRARPDDPDARNDLGNRLLAMGRSDDAARCFREAVVLDPGFAEAHFNLACLLATAQPPRLDEAREHYRRAVALGSERDADLDRLLGTP